MTAVDSVPVVVPQLPWWRGGVQCDVARRSGFCCGSVWLAMLPVTLVRSVLRLVSGVIIRGVEPGRAAGRRADWVPHSQLVAARSPGLPLRSCLHVTQVQIGFKVCTPPRPAVPLALTGLPVDPSTYPLVGTVRCGRVRRAGSVGRGGRTALRVARSLSGGGFKVG